MYCPDPLPTREAQEGQRRPRVCVVTVTYGDRRRVLERVVCRLLDVAESTPELHSILIVDNGSTGLTKEYLQHLAELPNCEIATLEENLGSAVGFGTGLDRGQDAGCDYIWLLDDDNLPDQDALQILVSHVRRYGCETAFLSLRKDRQEYSAIANGRNVDSFADENSFLGFSVIGTVRRLLGIPPEPVESEYGLIPLPYGPYGGLFLPTCLLPLLGRPRTDYYIYGDDHEFTYRLRRLQIPLLLAPPSVVRDIETSWSKDQSVTNNRFHSLQVPEALDENSALRFYYSTRNRIHFETEYRVTNWVEYWLNASIKAFALFCFSTVRSLVLWDFSPLRSLSIALRAVSDGASGRLGLLKRPLDRGNRRRAKP
jgi:GT2 family glycosyltransferase